MTQRLPWNRLCRATGIAPWGVTPKAARGVYNPLFCLAASTSEGFRRGCRTRPEGSAMKEGIHPNYREVCFLDLSNNFKFVTRSCANTKETIKMDDGRELPLFKLDTSSESHPFYTGTQKSVDNMGGRVEKFRNRYAKTAK
jgi:large subunit ribosomal protein L31